MPTVLDVLSRKRSLRVYTIGADDSVMDAAELMNAESIGGVVVTRGDQVVGMFTERDVLRRVVAKRLDPDATTVQQVMSSPIATCSRATTIADCKSIMASKRIRHLPVVDDGLFGMITSTDIIAYQVSERDAEIRYLKSFRFDIGGEGG